jgi:preprotein translocase subunit YajC
MYFFVGRPQKWYAYLEIYNVSGTFQVGETVTGGGLSGTVQEVHPNSLLLAVTNATSAPASGSTMTGGTSSATAKASTYRYATEDAPPAPIDNQIEKAAVYDDIIAAKRITSTFARLVAPRYNWSLSTNPKFDMYRPNYSPTPAGGGAIGVQTALGSSALSGSKYYVMNSNYEVFKCLYNGQTPANPTGINATYEPKTSPTAGQGTYANGLFTESATGYIWKYMYTLSTADVIAFLSSDFLPMGTYAGPAAVDGAVHIAVIKDGGANMPTNGTVYVGVDGDGTGAIVKITTSAGGAISSVEMEAVGSGYTYGNVRLVNGNVYSDTGLSNAVTIAANATGSVEVIMSPEGGHGADLAAEFFAKRVMTNIRLTYAEGSGDFPVDNDFRRIGIIQDPFNYGTTTVASASTLRGTAALKLTGSGDYTIDEEITQTVSGGTAKGRVVSWDSTNGILKYFQSPDLHTHNGKVLAFDHATNNVTGATSSTARPIDANQDTALADISFTDGKANPEIAPNSGDIVYIENRRQITRAADQIEDIKLVIEF